MGRGFIDTGGVTGIFGGSFCGLMCLIATVVSSSHMDDTSNHGTVYVVSCVDTESGGFNYSRFSQSLNLNSFKPGNIISHALDPNWRNRLKDSYGNTLEISWFLMTIEGYRHTPGGINAVADEFIGRFSDDIVQLDDEIGWHYHHADWFLDSGAHFAGWNKLESFSGIVYREKTDRALAIQQLAAFVYLNRFYPAAFRAGWNWENTDFSNWLDSLIPFDYSNNWENVDANIDVYSPSESNVFAPGHRKRFIVRSIEGLDSSYIDHLFKKAAEGHDVVLSFYTHNYGGTSLKNNPITKKFEGAHKYLLRISERHKVAFEYCTAKEAVMEVRKLKCGADYELSIGYDFEEQMVSAQWNPNTYGVPLLCYRCGDQIYGMLFNRDTAKNRWSLKLAELCLDTFVVASISRWGGSFVSSRMIP